jgi:hypothetical protein
MQNRLSPEFFQRMGQQQKMAQMMGGRGNPRRSILSPAINTRQQPMQPGRPLFNQGKVNDDFSVTITNPDPRGPYRTRNQSIAPKFRGPTQGGK